MKRLYLAAVAYAGLGLASGLFYREVTKASDFAGNTQLAVAHTHLLALGFLVMLLALALDTTLKISATRAFSWFFATYNAGLILTAAVMVWHGMLQINGQDDISPAVPGLAGLGHILLTVGIICLIGALRRPVREAIDHRAIEEDITRATQQVKG